MLLLLLLVWCRCCSLLMLTCMHGGRHCRWPTYMQLVAASMSSMVKDNNIVKYLALVKDLHDTPDMDGLMHKVVQHMRGVLGHANNHHIWYRVALTATNNVAATIFDDLTQVRGSGWVEGALQWW